MDAVLIGHHEPNTPEWAGLRAKGLGGSEIAAVVGLSPWVSRFALYHRKRGTLGPQIVNSGMDWGHRLEGAVCKAWAEKRDMLDVEKAGTYRHHERPWQIANPDRLLYDDEHGSDPVGFLEVKTSHAYDAWEWGYGDEDVPPYYRCQALWYMDVLGFPECPLAVLIGGSDYREYTIRYSPDEAEWLRAEGEQFWQDVLDGNDPEIDGHDATYKAVREMHPEIERGVDAEIDADLWAHYQMSKSKAADWTEVHQGYKSEVLTLMGEAQFATVNGTSVLRRQPGRGGSVSLYEIKQPMHDAPTGDAA